MPPPCLAILLLSAGVAGSASEPAADLLLTGREGLDRRRGPSLVEVVAAARTASSSSERTRKRARSKGPKTKVVALRGRLVTPGFEDAQLHLMSGMIQRVDLAEETTLAGLQDIGSFAEANPNSPWIVDGAVLWNLFRGVSPHAR